MQELVTVYMDLALVVVLGSCVWCRLEYCSMFISVSVCLSVYLCLLRSVYCLKHTVLLATYVPTTDR